MPFIIRIILQRAIIGMTTVLAFLGLSPSTHIPTQSEAIVQIEQRQEEIQKIVEVKDNTLTPNEIIAKIDSAKNTLEKKVDSQVQKIKEKETSAPKSEVVAPKTSTPKEITIPKEITVPQTRITPEIKIDVEQKQITIPEVKKFVEEKIAEQVATETTDFTKIEDVVVNIICTSKQGNFTSAQTGSGVLVSSAGVVLTNAHVAHPFLLDNHTCLLYQKNNPYFGYRASLLYIQEEWVEKNRDIAAATNPRGTGEDDYAFLLITSNSNPGGYLPSKFPYTKILVDKNIYEVGQTISVGGFPGAPATLLDLARAGNLKTDETAIDDVFTFSSGPIDVISTENTPVAARGASGGGIFKDDNLIALTVTTSGSGNNARINGITTAYIDRDMRADIGIGISAFITGDLHTRASNFMQNEFAKLADILNG